MRLNDLGPAGGATRRRIRIGRGHGSGKVKTGGKGTKGQNARAGGGVPPYFEGGQLPLIRKLPYRRGFVNPFRVEYREVNVRDLAVFEAGASVGPDELDRAGILHGHAGKIKVLGDGDLAVRLTVRAHRFTNSARQKIEAAGGTVEELEPRAEPEAPKQPRPRRATDEDSE